MKRPVWFINCLGDLSAGVQVGWEGDHVFMVIHTPNKSLSSGHEEHRVHKSFVVPKTNEGYNKLLTGMIKRKREWLKRSIANLSIFVEQIEKLEASYKRVKK